jgi:hypothetical protein
MAVPGAGKTRTVKQAATAIHALYHREKFTDAHDFIVGLRKIVAEQAHLPETYQARKDCFLQYCKQFMLSFLNSEDMKDTLFVLHSDEAQLLMGEIVVSKTQQSEDLYNYIIPAFGDALKCFTAKRKQFRVDQQLSIDSP